MSRIKWDLQGQHFYETGVNQGVLYTVDPDKESQTGNKYNAGVAWNGLTSVSESPEGAEVSAIYADNIKYLNLMSAEDFKGTIEAYTYPDDFAECDGSAALAGIAGISMGQQTRKLFGLCYTTKIGNDETSELGYKIHIVYNCLASPSERSYETVNDSPEAITFSWEFSTTPVTFEVTEGEGASAKQVKKSTATLVIDSTKFKTTEEKAKLKLLEDTLFGTDPEGQSEGTDPTLLLPQEIITLLA